MFVGANRLEVDARSDFVCPSLPIAETFFSSAVFGLAVSVLVSDFCPHCKDRVSDLGFGAHSVGDFYLTFSICFGPESPKSEHPQACSRHLGAFGCDEGDAGVLLEGPRRGNQGGGQGLDRRSRCEPGVAGEHVSGRSFFVASFITASSLSYGATYRRSHFKIRAG